MTHDCFVIGSGPSLQGFDFDTLPEAFRVGANKSGWLANCDVLVTLDRYFPSRLKDEILKFDGEVVIARRPDEEMVIPDATYVMRERGDGFSEDIGALRGYDSGFASLNYAYLLGYRNIGLLGFDFKWVDNKSHFHDGYRSQNKNTHHMLGRWAKAFDRVADKVCCTNYVGPSGSNVTAFPTRPLEDLL
jgi:hypothetical protein